MLVFSQALINGITDGAFLAMIALGATLVFGVARFPNVAHGDFLTLAAYGTLCATGLVHLPLLLAAICGIVLTVIVGLASYALIFRKIADRPITCLIVSIGLALVVRDAILFVAGGDAQAYDLPVWRAWRLGGFVILPLDAYITVLSAAAIFAVHLLLRYTRIGVEMRAVSDDPSLARVGGVSPERVNIATWSVALALAGAAGILVAAKTLVFPDLGWTLLLPALAAAILGGLGSPYGAILAGMLLGLSQNIATIWIGDTYKDSFAFVVLIVALLLRPTGLTGRLEAAR
jgi:branched-chain amino acid transport system permease protein